MFENTIKDIAYSQEIVDLEKENKELKSQIEQLKRQYKKQRNCRIDELQKENRELKACIKRYEELENWVADFLLRHYKPIEEVKRMEELIGTDYFKEGIK